MGILIKTQEISKNLKKCPFIQKILKNPCHQTSLDNILTTQHLGYDKTLFVKATRNIVQALVVGLTLVIFNAINNGIGLSIARVFDNLDGNQDGYIFG
jgi:hypothetical protein